MSSADKSVTILREHRSFAPPAAFKRQANLGSLSAYEKLHAESIRSPETFWGRMAREHLVWRKPFKTVLQCKASQAIDISAQHWKTKPR